MNFEELQAERLGARAVVAVVAGQRLVRIMNAHHLTPHAPVRAVLVFHEAGDDGAHAQRFGQRINRRLAIGRRHHGELVAGGDEESAVGDEAFHRLAARAQGGGHA